MSEQGGNTSLTSLPAALLEEIARDSLGSRSFFYLRCQPLLGVARETRDASLRRASKIALDLKPSNTVASVQPLARLLSRACSLASSLELNIVSKPKEEDQADKVFAALLHASGPCGWDVVNSLYLQYMSFGPASSQLVGPAFPNLRTLELWLVDLGQGGVLASLQDCRQLSKLWLWGCGIDETAVAGSAVLLSHLSSLRELTFGEYTPEALAVGITQLTSLSIEAGGSHPSTLCAFSQQFSQLQHLNISPEWCSDPNPGQLRRLLLALTQLQSLQMSTTAINQQGLDAVLEHGRHLTKLGVSEMFHTESRARSATNLKALQWQGLVSIEPWAYLPLHSMEALTVKSFRFEDEQELPGEEWWLPVQCREGSDLLLPLFAQAVSNILHCPVWAASGTGLTLGLLTGEDNWDPDADGGSEPASYCSSMRLGIIRALAPLMPRVSHLSILMPGFTLGGAEVAALGEVAGPHITHFSLRAADVCRDFWPAVWAHLPVLHTLTLLRCEGAISEAELSMLCIRAPRPFTLVLTRRLYKEVNGAGIEESWRLWGTPQVTVKQVNKHGDPC